MYKYIAIGLVSSFGMYKVCNYIYTRYKYRFDSILDEVRIIQHPKFKMTVVFYYTPGVGYRIKYFDNNDKLLESSDKIHSTTDSRRLYQKLVKNGYKLLEEI